MANKIEVEFEESSINIGISDKERRAVARELNKLLADAYLLYLKTQNYHWNVTGKQFRSLHLLFEEQYKEQAEAIDTIAERIRALGEFVPASFSSFSKITSLKEETSIPAAEEMIHRLVIGNEAVIACAREIINLADECEDDVTSDLMIQRMKVHEKNAWMLRSLISPAHKTH